MNQNALRGISPFPSNHSSQNGLFEQNPQLDQQITSLVLGLLSDAKVLSEIQRLKPFPLNLLPMVLHGAVLNKLCSNADLFSYMHVSKLSRGVIFHQNNIVLLKRVLNYMICSRSIKMVMSRNHIPDSPQCTFTFYRYDVKTNSYVEHVSPLVSAVARMCQEVVLPLITSGNLIAAKEKLDEIKKQHVTPDMERLDKHELVKHLDKSYETISKAQIEKGDIPGAKMTIKELTDESVRDSLGKVIVRTEINKKKHDDAMSTIALLISKNERYSCYDELQKAIENIGTRNNIISVLKKNVIWNKGGIISIKK